MGRRALKFLAALVLMTGLSLAVGFLPALAQEPPAMDLVQRLGCFACHGEGQGKPAHSLKGVGSRLSPGQLQVVLTQPRKLYPGVKMPSYAYLPESERQMLLDFLVGLK